VRRTNNEDNIITLNLFGRFEADRGKRGEKLKTYLLTIGNFNDYIYKEFGREKCAKIVEKEENYFTHNFSAWYYYSTTALQHYSTTVP